MKLDVPATNEEGSAVVVSVSVDVPPSSYVTDVLVVADGNKNAGHRHLPLFTDERGRRDD